MHRLLTGLAAVALVATAQPSFAADLQAGKDLYSDNCAICHGNKGEGYALSAVPDGAVQIKKLAGDAAYWDFSVFKEAVLNGKDDKGRAMRMMPVFSKTGLFNPPGQMLTDQDLKNIQAYMQTFGPNEG